MSAEKPKNKGDKKEREPETERAQVKFPKGIKTAVEIRLYRALIPKHLGGSGEDPIDVISFANTFPPDQVTHPLLREALEHTVRLHVIKDALVELAKKKPRGIKAHVRRLLEKLSIIKKQEKDESELEEDAEEGVEWEEEF